MKKKILIVGDSYGAPTYAYLNWTKRAFPDWKSYENIALGGTSFWRTVDNLHHVKDWNKFKHCIIFWSEHMRIYVRSTNSFIGGEGPFLNTTSRDPSPWSIKTKGKHIFNKPVAKARLVQKNVEKSYELGIMEREFENLKAYSCLQYFYNVFYKKYPKVNFINIHCFPWLEEVAESFDVDVNFKSSGNVIHVDGNMLEDFSTVGKEFNNQNHMTDEQNIKFSKFISQIIDRLDNGDEITKNPDLRKIK